MSSNSRQQATGSPAVAPSSAANELKTKVHDDVARLLSYAVKRPNISIKPEFLEKAVPILCREVKDLTPQDHIDLWNAYNHLSSLLSPVTAESLETDEELNKSHNLSNKKNKWQKLERSLIGLLVCMGLFVLAVFGTQAYSIMMDNNLETLSNLTYEYTKVVDDEALARKASGNAVGAADKEPLLAILDKKEKLKVIIKVSATRQFHLNKWFWCEQDSEPTIGSGGSSDQQAFLSRVNTTRQCGNAIKLMVSSLFLPMLLGFLGAIAFITRNTLNHLNDSTFTPSWGGRYVMRAMLGGLLGVIGPWLYASGNVDEIGLGLSLFAFLLGYSVELAFSLFDKFISYAREKIKPGGEANAASLFGSAIADSPGTQPTPYQPSAPKEPAAGNNVANLKQQLASYRKSLTELVEWEPLLATVTLPDYFKLECTPKIEQAKYLLKQFDAYNNASTPDIGELVNATTQLNQFSKTVSGEHHPLTKILRSAVSSFSESSAGNDDAATNSLVQSEAFVVTLFAGATAAFDKGPSAYERWLAYVWSQPFTPRFITGLDLAPNALDCLKSTTLFQIAIKEQAETLAKTLLDLALNNQDLEELAERLWQTPTELKGLTGDLAVLFGSIEVFKEGWNEYGHCLLRYALQKDFPSDRFNTDETLLAVSETLAIVDSLRQNQASEKDLDILCHLSLELMKRAQTSSTFDAVELIRRSISGARQ